MASARVAGAGVCDALEDEPGDAVCGAAGVEADGVLLDGEVPDGVVVDGEAVDGVVVWANAACGKASIVPPSNAASAIARPNCAGTANEEVEADIDGVPFWSGWPGAKTCPG